MTTTDRPVVGMSHPTVVPANFDPERERCPECGRPTVDERGDRSDERSGRRED